MDRRPAYGEPFFLQWHLTDHCNLRCRHCYRDGTPKQSLDYGSLSEILDRFQRWLASVGRSGRIQFAGGEPLLSEHLLPLVREATRRRLPTRVLSNGTLLSPELARALRAAGCRIVQVSIDGLNGTHDAIRGAGTFEAALRGAINARQAGLEVTFQTTLTRANLGQIDAIGRLAGEYADRVGFARLVPAGRGASLNGDLLSAREWRAATRRIGRLRRQLSIEVPLRDPTFRGYLLPRRRARSCIAISGCSAGYNGIAIDADGTVYPCRRLPIALGNIVATDFADLWQTDLMQQLRGRDALGGKCGRCDWRWQCGGCRAIAFAATGDPLAEDPQCFW